MALFILFFIYLTNVESQHNCFPDAPLEFPVQDSNLPSIKSTFSPRGLSQIEFEVVINKFYNFWSPILEQKYNKKLIFDNDWEAARVNASTTRDENHNPIIKINGGLARHPEITKNGLLMILCHELGHHLGGAPKSFRGRSQKRSWSSAEGQADYFATTKCMAKMFMHNQIFPELNKFEVKSCQNILCLKMASAALSVGNLFASLKGEWKRPSLNQRSQTNVHSTYYSHPNPQCRVDTFIAGSLCSNLVEKEFDDLNYKIGSCLEEQDPKAARPRCWFNHSKY